LNLDFVAMNLDFVALNFFQFSFYANIY